MPKKGDCRMNPPCEEGYSIRMNKLGTKECCYKQSPKSSKKRVNVKKVKVCKEGTVLNPKTNRCNKIKSVKSKKINIPISQEGLQISNPNLVKNDLNSNKNRMYDQLEKLLKEFSDIKLIASTNENIDKLVSDHLEKYGMALINVNEKQNNKIRTITGKYMTSTFEKLSDNTKEELSQGNFDKFSKEWVKKPFRETEIAFKSFGMANSAMINPSDRSLYTHPITKTVHTDNVLNALNNIKMWRILQKDNQNLSVDKIFTPPLGYRTQVSEDGIKIMNYQKYTPTDMHYDGQLGKYTGKDARRVQAVYISDQGPTRLFCVPGTHSVEIIELIQRITETSEIQPGFIKLKKEFQKNPKLKEILYKYGIALPTNGLLLFRAGVWHFEGSCNHENIDPRKPVKNIVTSHSQINTKKSKIFRIYCGVVFLPDEYKNDLIVMAYMRLNKWSMDVYSPQNKKKEYFVNQKTTQFKTVTIKPDQNTFKSFANVSLNEMKHFLKKHKSYLKYFGLSPQDL